MISVKLKFLGYFKLSLSTISFFCKYVFWFNCKMVKVYHFIFRSLQEVQLDFYIEQSALCKAQKLVAEQQVKTLAAQEAYYKFKLSQSEF